MSDDDAVKLIKLAGLEGGYNMFAEVVAGNLDDAAQSFDTLIPKEPTEDMNESDQEFLTRVLLIVNQQSKGDLKTRLRSINRKAQWMYYSEIY